MSDLNEQQLHSLDVMLRKRGRFLREVIGGEPAVSAGQRHAELYANAGDEADVAVADLLTDIDNSIVHRPLLQVSIFSRVRS